MLLLPSALVVPAGAALLGFMLRREDERLRLQIEVAGQSDLLNKVINSIGEYAVVVARRDYSISVYNNKARELFGHGMPVTGGPETWVTDLPVFTEDGSQRLTPEQRPLVRAIAGESITDQRYSLKDLQTGQHRIINVTARPLIGENELSRGGLVIFHDISRQARLEEELRESRAQLRDAIEAMESGFALFDADDRLVICNKGFVDEGTAERVGMPIGRTFEEIFTAFADAEMTAVDALDDREAWLAWRLAVHRNPPAAPLEVQWTDGRWMRVTERLTAGGSSVGTWTDITEIRARQTELSDAKKRSDGQALELALRIAELEAAQQLIEQKSAEQTAMVEQLSQADAAIESANRELAINAALMRSVMDIAPVLVGFLDDNFVYRYCNHYYAEMFGVAAAEIVGKHARVVLGETYFALAEPSFRTVLRGDKVSFDRVIMLKGEQRDITGIYLPCLTGDGRVTGFYAMIWDVTDARRREAALEEQANIDALTGALNRRGLDDLLRRESAAATAGRSNTLLYLDLDHFKQINDSMGHEIGDLVLKTFVAHIQSEIRAEDRVARLGGDEFIVLLRGVSSDSTAQRIASDLLRRVSQPLVIGGQRLTLSTSIGVPVAPADTAPDQFLREADRALYEAKKAGRNTFIIRNIA